MISIDSTIQFFQRSHENNLRFGDAITFGQFSQAFNTAEAAGKKIRVEYDQGSLTLQKVESEAANVIGGGLKVAGASLMVGASAGEAFLMGKAVLPANQPQNNQVKLLNPPIKNIDKVMKDHIIPDHTGLNPTKSAFNSGVDIKGLIQRGTQMPMIKSRTNFVRTYDTGKIIGIDRATKLPTSIINIITNKLNELKSAYPGTVKIHK